MPPPQAGTPSPLEKVTNKRQVGSIPFSRAGVLLSTYSMSRSKPQKISHFLTGMDCLYFAGSELSVVTKPIRTSIDDLGT